MAVSLRREEKESSGGGTLHSYRIIVRTTQVGRGLGNQTLGCLNSLRVS